MTIRPTWGMALVAVALASMALAPLVFHHNVAAVDGPLALSLTAAVNMRYQVPNYRDAQADWSSVRAEDGSAHPSALARVRWRLQVNVVRLVVVPLLLIVGAAAAANVVTSSPPLPVVPASGIGALRVLVTVTLSVALYGGEAGWAAISWLEYRHRHRYGVE